MAVKPVSAIDLDLLKKEIGALGEAAESDRLEQRAEIDRLKLELETLKRAISARDPEFARRFESLRVELTERYDPETGEERTPEPGSPEESRAQEQVSGESHLGPRQMRGIL